jgi:hypothetical protein
VPSNLVGRWPAHVQRDQTATASTEVATNAAHDDALEFVRFCYRRRRVAWPALYDEMCAVAARGAFRGLGYAELSDLGISFCLGELHRLATLTERVVAEDRPAAEAAAAQSVAMMLTAQPARG